MMNTSEQLELRSLADWLPRGEAWACEAAELLRRAADQIDQLRAEIDRLRPLAAIGTLVGSLTVDQVQEVLDATEWRKNTRAAAIVDILTDAIVSGEAP